MANNLIQIKRSLTTAVPASLANGEFAFTSNGDVLYIGANGAVTPIAGKRVPGVLTANQALVANATSGIDKIIVANAAISQLNANGATGTAGQVLKSGGPGANSYWADTAAGVAGSDTQVQFNDGGSLAGDTGLTYNKTTDALSVAGAVNVGANVVVNTTMVFVGNSSVNADLSSSLLQITNSTSTANLTAVDLKIGIAVVNSTVIAVGSNNFINATALDVGNTVISTTNAVFGGTIAANGSIGSAGQALISGGAANAYWTTIGNGTITGVTAGNGLTGGGTTGTVTLDVGGGNGITVAADAISVDGANGISVDASGVNVQAGTNGGLSVNATGVWVVAGNGVNVGASGVGVTGGSGLVSNTSGVHVGAANGITVDADAIRVTEGVGLSVNATGVHVKANSGIVANSTGVFVNANTSGGLSVNTTLQVKIGTGLVFDGTGNVAVNSAALSFQDLTVSGNLSVLGDLVSMNVATLAVEDPLIVLAKDQSNTGTFTDAVDIGFYGSYGNTAQKNWAGLFRDQSDSGVFKLFSGNIPEPTTTVDTANVNFAYSTLQTFLKTGGAGATGLIANATNIAITANSTLDVAITANTLSLSTALPATSGGTGKNTTSVGGILVGNSTNTFTELAAGTDGYVLQINGTGIVAWNTLDGGTF